jgi:hypothetical protein
MEPKVIAARERAAAAADYLATTRVAVHRGSAKRAELATAEQAAKDAAHEQAALEQEYDAVTKAAAAVARDQAAHNASHPLGRRPALQAEYQKRLRAFAATLAEAAIACEALTVIHDVVVSSDPDGRITSVWPWPELRVTNSQSKFRRWMATAIGTGLLQQED